MDSLEARQFHAFKPYERFFANCHRLQISAVGKRTLCLFDDEGISKHDLLISDDQPQVLMARIVARQQSKKRRPSCTWVIRG